MLHPGLYEQVINNTLNSELSEVPEVRKSTAPIDTAEASKVLAQYLTDVVQKGLENVQDNGGGIEAQIQLANEIVSTIQTTTHEPNFALLGVDQRAEQLLALLRDNDPCLAAGMMRVSLIICILFRTALLCWVNCKHCCGINIAESTLLMNR